MWCQVVSVCWLQHLGPVCGPDLDLAPESPCKANAVWTLHLDCTLLHPAVLCVVVMPSLVPHTTHQVHLGLALYTVCRASMGAYASSAHATPVDLDQPQSQCTGLRHPGPYGVPAVPQPFLHVVHRACQSSSLHHMQACGTRVNVCHIRCLESY